MIVVLLACAASFGQARPGEPCMDIPKPMTAGLSPSQVTCVEKAYNRYQKRRGAGPKDSGNYCSVIFQQYITDYINCVNGG